MVWCSKVLSCAVSWCHGIVWYRDGSVMRHDVWSCCGTARFCSVWHGKGEAQYGDVKLRQSSVASRDVALW